MVEKKDAMSLECRSSLDKAGVLVLRNDRHGVCVANDYEYHDLMTSPIPAANDCRIHSTWGVCMIASACHRHLHLSSCMSGVVFDS